MKVSKILPALLLGSALWLSSCGPKDADIKTAVTEKIAAIPGTIVDVKDGVVTLSGEVKDAAAKAAIDAALEGIKGVKSVVNNVTVAAPVAPAATVDTSSVENETSDALAKAVVDATKDFPSVTASVKEGVISLSGSIKKVSLPKLMMSLSALHPKKIDNKLTVN